MRTYIRFKLAMTEDTPTIKPYKEGMWAALEDYKPDYLHHSLQMLDAVHAQNLIIYSGRWISRLS